MSLRKIEIDFAAAPSSSRSRDVIKRSFIEPKEKTLPGKAEMAANVSRSIGKTAKAFFSGKKITVEHSLKDKRMKICEGCAWFIKKSQRCASCGCFVPLKAFLEEESCPVGKW